MLAVERYQGKNRGKRVDLSRKARTPLGGIRAGRGGCVDKLSVARHEEAEHVPEEEHDGGEEGERGGDVLVGAVFVENAGGVVEDVSAGEDDHEDGEEGAELEPEEHAADDEGDGADAGHAKEWAEEGEVLAGDEDKRGEGDEGSGGGETCGRDDVGAAVLGGDEHEGQEDDGLGNDVESESGVLHGRGSIGLGPAVGEPADADEGSEHDEPGHATGGGEHECDEPRGHGGLQQDGLKAEEGDDSDE